MFAGHSIVKVYRNQTVTTGVGIVDLSYFSGSYFIVLVPKTYTPTSSVSFIFVLNNSTGVQRDVFNFSSIGSQGPLNGILLTGDVLRFQNINITFDLFVFTANG